MTNQAPPPRLVPDRPSVSIPLDALAQIIGSMRNFAAVADHCTITEVVNGPPSIRTWADMLSELIDAAAPPAEAPADAHALIAEIRESVTIDSHKVADWIARAANMAEAPAERGDEEAKESIRAGLVRIHSGLNQKQWEDEAVAIFKLLPQLLAAASVGECRMCNGIGTVGDTANGYPESACPACAAPAAPAEGVTVERLAKHELAAGECPPQSRVVLLSSLHRMLATAPRVTGGREDDEQHDFDAVVDHNIALQDVINDAIKIHSSFGTTADMADWLRDSALQAATGGGEE